MSSKQRGRVFGATYTAGQRCTTPLYPANRRCERGQPAAGRAISIWILLAESSGLHAPFIGRRIIRTIRTGARHAKKLAVILLSARRSSARAHIFRFPRRKRKTRPRLNRIASPAGGRGARSCLRLRLQSAWLRARLRPHDAGGRDRRATQRRLVIVACIAHRSMPLQKLRDLSAGKCLIFEETFG